MIKFAGEDDFRSIGLRPMEYRPAIIRRAMTRSALPLVQLHLQRPDAGVERRLSHIITLGYHLLDPRRRADSLQRMMLGPVHPQLSDEAVRMAQTKGTPIVFAPKRHAVHPTSHAHFSSAEGAAWDVALQSHDLSLDRSASLWRRRAMLLHRGIVGQPRRLVVAAGSLVLAAMLWLAWPSGTAAELSKTPSSTSLPSHLKPSHLKKDAAGLVKSVQVTAPCLDAWKESPMITASVSNPAVVNEFNAITEANAVETVPVVQANDRDTNQVSTQPTSISSSLTPSVPLSTAPSLREAMEAWDKLSTDVSKTASAVASLFPQSEAIPAASETDSPATMPSLDAAVDGVPDLSEFAPVANPWQPSVKFEQL